MAFHITITKTSEEATLARYRFEGDGRVGSLTISKVTAEIARDGAVGGDDGGLYFSSAAAKLRKHWQEGLLPDRTEWAS
jgi:hypothetical protein